VISSPRARRAHRAAIGRIGMLLVVGVVLGGTAAAPMSASAAVGKEYYPISGVGSTWSANALQQWIRNVWNNYRWKVEYNDAGSSAGRQLFSQNGGGYDFAVSEIPYQLKDSDSADPRPARKFVYMPIVAGGTSFMYNLVIGGKKVTNLRLGGATLAKIFTGVITKWNDPAIAVDNPKLALPATPIIPVVRSDGSGTSAQFSSWMRKQFPSIWSDFCVRAKRPANCGITSNYPTVSGSAFVSQSGSNGVAGYVAQPQYVGSITYVEYSYALNSRSPVAKILNTAGYYTEPTAANVAVSLLGAQINSDPSSPDYLTQQLDGVYGNPDPRTYPLSSYSYMIIPTALEYGFTENKGLTLAAFTNYFLCEGQQQAEVLGYSPLPINLVTAGLDQVRKIPGGDPASVNIAKCNNPTFSPDGSNKLANTAPQPQACDKQGGDQCATGTGGVKTQATALSSGTKTGTGSTATGAAAGTTTDASGPTTAAVGPGLTLSGASGPSVVTGVPTKLPVPSGQWLATIALAAVAFLVLFAIFGPPAIARRNAVRKPRAVARAPGRKVRMPNVNLRVLRRPRSPEPPSTGGI
jgi:phosphate transport system substrate-binding protein